MLETRKVGRWFRRTLYAMSVAAVIGLGVVPTVVPTVVWGESRVDLNDATVEELTSLPGIGPARARAILERREEAPFESADELAEVPGIGLALVERLRDRVEVSRADRSAKSVDRR